MNGIDVVAEIKNHRDIPVIYLTASGDSLTGEREELTMTYGFIVKPVNLNRLYRVYR